MSAWREKIEQLVKRRGTDEPEPFGLTCPCGATVEGFRAERHQRVICRQCGEVFYVLPRNVYPPPQRRKKKQPPSAVAQEWLTSTATAVQTVSRSAVERVTGKVRSTVRSFFEWARSLLTPVRVVILGVVVVVVATGWWVHRSRQLEQAAVVLKEATEEGERALRSGDVFTAWKAFDQAAQAVDTLGRDDQLARRVRQLARETEAANNLCPKTLVELLEEADQVCRRRGAEAWKSVMGKYYRGTWVVLQTRVRRRRPEGSSSETESPSFDLDCPLVVAGRPVQFDGSLPVLERLDWSKKSGTSGAKADKRSAAPDDARQVILAVQLDQCWLERGRPGKWVVRCEPRSAFLWTDYATLRLAGLTPNSPQDEQRVKQILAEQERLVLGESESPEP